MKTSGGDVQIVRTLAREDLLALLRFVPSLLRCKPTQPGNNLRFLKDILFGFGVRRQL
jgi:hypothetical protein